MKVRLSVVLAGERHSSTHGRSPANCDFRQPLFELQPHGRSAAVDVRRNASCGKRPKVEFAASSGGDFLDASYPFARAAGAYALAPPSSLHRPSAAPATGPTRYLTGSDLFNLEIATDPQISPDGRTIAYVRSSNDIMTDKAQLDDLADRRRVGPAASARSPRAGSYFSPRWSPDGSRLAYVAADDGSHAALRPLDGERRKRAHHRASRQPGQHRLVARRTAHRLLDVRPRRRAETRAGASPSPKARNGPSRCRSSTPSPIAPTARAISSPATTRSSGCRPTAARRRS